MHLTLAVVSHSHSFTQVNDLLISSFFDTQKMTFKTYLNYYSQGGSRYSAIGWMILGFIFLQGLVLCCIIFLLVLKVVPETIPNR